MRVSADRVVRVAIQTSHLGDLHERLPGLVPEAGPAGVRFVAPLAEGWSLTFRRFPPVPGTLLERLLALAAPCATVADVALRPPAASGLAGGR